MTADLLYAPANDAAAILGGLLPATCPVEVTVGVSGDGAVSAVGHLMRTGREKQPERGD